MWFRRGSAGEKGERRVRGLGVVVFREEEGEGWFGEKEVREGWERGWGRYQ